MREKGTAKECPFCGYFENAPHLPSYLAPRTVLQKRYLVGKVLDSNGEGVTYIGYDLELGTPVTLREFFPETICSRVEQGRDVKVLAGCENLYAEEMQKFVALQRRLARARDLHSIISIYDIFEENGTAYGVYEYVKAVTLKEYLKEYGDRLNWEEVRVLFMPLMATFISLHALGIYHCGVSPDTLLVDNDGKLRLSGFCIEDVRTAHSDLVPELFSGYSALEQYDSAEKQGSATDVYSFCAVMYRALSGITPQDALSRANEERLFPLRLDNSVPDNVREALCAGLKLNPYQRIASFEELRKLFTNMSTLRDTRPIYTETDAYEEDDLYDEEYDEEEKPRKNYLLISLLVTAIVLLILIVVLVMFLSGGDKSKNSSSTGSGIVISIEPSSLTPSGVSSSTEIVRKYVVPDFSGQDINEVLLNPNYSEMFTLVKDSVEYSNTVPKDQIIEQTPKEGTQLEAKGEVKLKVSKGPSEVIVPPLVGLTLDQAREQLKELGVPYQVRDYTDDPYLTKNVVGKSEPEMGQKVSIEKSEQVILYVGTYEEPSSIEPPSSSESPSHRFPFD